jgi:hypothetical protein
MLSYCTTDMPFSSHLMVHESVSPRVFRIVAPSAPSEPEEGTLKALSAFAIGGL